MASLWAHYTFKTGLFSGLGLGAGVRYVGKGAGDPGNTFFTDDYALVDAAISYDLGAANAAMKGWKGSGQRPEPVRQGVCRWLLWRRAVLFRPAPHRAGDLVLSLVRAGGMLRPERFAFEGYDGAPARRPLELPHAHSLAFSARNGAEYRLLVAVPPEPAPAAGFPVLILADGDALFPTALSAARLQGGRPEVTGVGPGRDPRHRLSRRGALRCRATPA